MASSAAKPQLFQGKPTSFESIIAGRAGGGPETLATYIETRISQIARRLATTPDGEAEHTTALAGLAAFESARHLLPQITNQLVERRLASAARVVATGKQATKR